MRVTVKLKLGHRRRSVMSVQRACDRFIRSVTRDTVFIFFRIYIISEFMLLPHPLPDSVIRSLYLSSWKFKLLFSCVDEITGKRYNPISYYIPKY